jgi:hypothetical protein
MANLNKKFENIENLVQREFNVDETVQLLKLNQTVFWSWGVERLLNYQNKGLLLLVNGHHHKGWLLIVLAWNDTYSYYLLGANKTIIKEQHEVYFDMLQGLIDKDVEYIEDYK